MSLWELIASLGQEVVVEPEDNGCTFVDPKDQQLGLVYMVTDGSLARIDVTKPGIATLSGIQVGDTEQAVYAAYTSRVQASEHQYVDGHYLTVRSRDGHAAVVFETDGRIVTSFHIGRLPEAQWIEGCS
jgi:hypothetical protein